MKKNISFIFIIIVILFFISSRTQKTKMEIIPVYIPTEMHFVMEELTKEYLSDTNHIAFDIQEMSSNDLLTAPKKGIHIQASFLKPLKKATFYSPLVIIGYRKIYNLKQLKKSSISIPDPNYNATGVNAIQILQKEKLWDLLKRDISYENKGILSMERVDLGEKDYAIVSLADSYYIKNSSVVFSLENYTESSLQYRIKNFDTKKEEDTLFYEYLLSDKAIKIFQKYGFLHISTVKDPTKVEK